MTTTNKVLVKSIEEILIYESPDGGKTVYARKPGQIDRTLVHTDPQHQLEQEFYKKWVMWKDILLKSKSSPILKDLINQTEMAYGLIKEEDYD